LRVLWRTEVGRIDPGRLVFVDEMGTHTSLAPLYAYAPIGERALLEIPRNRGKNTTLLTSLHQGGMGSSMAVEGATTARVFEAYVKRLLAPALRPGQVVMIDNLGAHRPKRVRELIEARGCELIYLPPYSPDLNPLEEALSKVKHLLRKIGARTKGTSARSDGSSIGGREYRRRARVLRSLRLPHPGAATMKGAVRSSQVWSSQRHYPYVFTASFTMSINNSPESNMDSANAATQNLFTNGPTTRARSPVLTASTSCCKYTHRHLIEALFCACAPECVEGVFSEVW
jgi:transposase